MAEGGRSQQIVYQIHIHAANVQEGDNVRVENTETNIINSPIEQVNIQQQVAGNNTAEEPAGEDQDEIIEAVDEMNLSSSGSASSSVKKKGSISSDRGRSPQKQLPDVKKSGRKSIQTEIIEGEFVSLCGRSEFVEAAFCIKQLTPEQREKLGTNTFLLLSQCYAELDREDEATSCINKVTHLLMTSTSDVDDIINTANHLLNDKSYFRALVLFRIASDMYTRHTSLSADEIVRRIKDCVLKMHNAVELMIKSGGRSKVIALKYGCVYMSEMVENLRAVEKADSAIKAELVARCVGWIGNNYRSAGEYEKKIEFYKNGVDIMERQFGKNASKHQIYGTLLNNLGSSNHNLGRHSIAEEYYIKALVVYNNASDFSNEDKKQEFIEMAQKNLKNARAKMK